MSLEVLLGLLAAPVATLAGVLVTNRIAARKDEREARATDQANAVSGYAQLTKDLETDRRRHADENKELREALEQVRDDVEAARREVDELRDAVAQARRESAEARDTMTALAGWVRALHDVTTDEERHRWPSLPPGLAALVWPRTENPKAPPRAGPVA